LKVIKAIIIIAMKDAHFAVHAIFAPHHAFCCVTSPASLLLLPACCHLLSPPATSAAAARRGHVSAFLYMERQTNNSGLVSNMYMERQAK